MVIFSRLVIGISAITATLAAPSTSGAKAISKRGPFNFFLGPDHPLNPRGNLTARATNYNQDYTTGGTVNFSPSSDYFSVNWDTTDDFVVGVGWQPGSTDPITYSGSFAVNSGLGSLSVYGWSENPLVEYYVMESNIGIDVGGTQKGTFESDGGTYTVWETTRTMEPSIVGTATFNQYISIRETARTSGTVTIQNHFEYWYALGLDLGTLNYQVIAVESWDGVGSAVQSVNN